jgi:hypothetical protein
MRRFVAAWHFARCRASIVTALIAMSLAIAAMLVPLRSFGAGNDQVTGSVTFTGGGGFFKVTFSCFGLPTCSGVYTGVARDAGCPNSVTLNDGFTVSGLDLSHPGPISGTVTFAHDYNSSFAGGGTCVYTISSLPGSIAYAATWDGTTGTINFSGVDTDGPYQAVGSFKANIAPPPVFPMTVTGTVTATTANVTAQIQPRAQDLSLQEKAASPVSVFVFAHAPASRVGPGTAATLLRQGPPIAAELLDAPDPCVLAQVDANRQLVGVTASTMLPYFTGVLDSQGQAVAILANVPTPNVAGATMFVGYGNVNDASSMFASGVYQAVINIPGSTQCNVNLASAPAPRAPGALTGLWWNAAESGWGIHLTQRGGNVFAAWYTYDGAGNAKWYVSTCAGAGATSGTCNGTLYEVTGPNFFGGTFNPALVNATSAGNLRVNFSNVNAASMTYTVGSQTRTIALTRQPLASGTRPPAVDYSDIWWGGANESGWGMAMAQQYGITFLAWYVYDASGKPTWQVATCTMSGNSCTGTLYRTTGPPFGPTFNPGLVQAASAGSITVNFTDANRATLTYTVDGVSATKSITRQLF